MNPDRRTRSGSHGATSSRPGPRGAVPHLKRRRYSRGPIQSTKSLTVKLTMLAVVGTLLIGGLIAAQMAAGNDPGARPEGGRPSEEGVHQAVEQQLLDLVERPGPVPTPTPELRR